MSGQPVKSASDQNKFRNEYLETLALQESINDMNLQANKTYLLTGQLPPQSQLQDTRTNAEKLADVEKLKRDTADSLRPIAEPQLAYAIINKVINSPLNVDNSLFRFLAQRASSLTEQLLKVLPYGIAGDENDIETIVNFIKNMYSEQQGKFQSTKSYLNSINSQGTSSRIIGGNDIDAVIGGLNDIYKNLQILRQRGNMVGGIPNTGVQLQTMRDAISRLKDVLPTTEQIQLMLNEIDNPDPANPIPLSRRDLDEFYRMLEKLPKYNEVMSLINKINQHINSMNLELASEGINNLTKLFEVVLGIPPATLNRFRNIKDRQVLKQNQMNELKSEQTINDIIRQYQANDVASKAQKVFIVNDDQNAVYIRPGVGATFGGAPGTAPPVAPPATLPPAPVALPPTGGIGAPTVPGTPSAPKLSYIVAILRDLDLNDCLEVSRRIVGNRLFDNGITRLNMQLDNSLNALQDFINGANYPLQLVKNHIMGLLTAVQGYRPTANPPENELGVMGLGIKKRRQGRPRGSGVVKPIIEKPKTFVGFGINEINQKQLENGIVKIRRNTKTNYPDMPSKRVSKNLQGILKTIVGGGVPKYEELGRLDEEEKEYLNKIVSRSNLTDKLSVPAPSKDQKEKDIHNFEVMKGQIMSGNDSIELVKKFKLLIRKLSKQGLLPKNDVEDINDTLTDLGY